MTIKRVENPMDEDQIMVIVEGVIDQISFKEISPIDKFGNTHKGSIRVGEDWVNSVSVKTKDGFEPSIRVNVKDVWETLAVGDKVKIEVKEREWNGKTYYDSSISKIKLVKKGEAVAAKETADGGTVREKYKPKDYTGVSVGHSINGAFNLLEGEVVDNPDEAIRVAKEVHLLTEKLKAEYAKNNPSLTEYDVGAMVGQAVLSATRVVSFEDVETVARTTLDTIAPEITAFIKGGGEKVKEETPEAKPKTRAPRKTAAAAKAEETPSALADLDDDIPF